MARPKFSPKSTPSRGPTRKPHYLPHPWSRPSCDAKRHPDPIRRFATMHWTDRHTDRQADRLSTGKFDDHRPLRLWRERRGLIIITNICKAHNVSRQTESDTPISILLLRHHSNPESRNEKLCCRRESARRYLQFTCRNVSMHKQSSEVGEYRANSVVPKIVVHRTDIALPRFAVTSCGVWSAVAAPWSFISGGCRPGYLRTGSRGESLVGI